MSHRLGLHWIRVHPDQHDYAHIELAKMSVLSYNTGVVNQKVDRGATVIAHGLSNSIGGAITMSHSTPQPSALKVCTKCGESKPLSEYVLRKSGRQAGRYEARCKACSLVTTRKWRDSSRAHIAAYNATRRAQDYQSLNESMQKSRERFPERKQAGDAVRNEVRRGRFPPVWTQVCEHCQEAQAAHYHHHKGYSQEFKLDVIALCTECHGKAHWLE